MTNAPADSPATEKKTTRTGVRILCIVLACILLLALLLGGGYWWLYSSGRRALFGDKNHSVVTPDSLVDDYDADGSRVVYQGETYRLNPHVVSILCMGVDKEKVSDDAAYGANGQADSIFVAALDTSTGSLTILPLSRETMAEVATYSADGSYIGVKTTQLCLAYSYGSTGTESCRNVQRSVSRLLYGVDIDAYLAMDLAGLEIMTDKLGGVQLTALEDVSGYTHVAGDADTHKPVTIQKGQTLTLDGITARVYIRGRGEDAEANARRMLRQKQFLSALLQKAGSNLKDNFTLLPSYFNTLKPYIVTDLSLSRITYLTGTALKTGVPSPRYISVTGQSTLHGAHAEFRPDSASLYEAVLEMFYVKQ